MVNFAGGRGSVGPDEVRDEDTLVDSFMTYGKSFRVPTIWLYSENDLYFGPALAQRFLSAFKSGGARVQFISLPAWGEDGHSSFLRAQDNWVDAVYEFLQKIGLISSLGLLQEQAA